MSGAGDGLVINEQAVTEVAERIPVRHGDAARRTTAGLPVGQLFGNSPAARSLAETWRLAVDHHRLVTEGLEQDLVELRQALHAVVDNTAASEAQSAARYARAAQDFATVAERSAAHLATSTEGFTAANESEVAHELAEQYAAEGANGAPGQGPGGPLDGADNAANPAGDAANPAGDAANPAGDAANPAGDAAGGPSDPAGAGDAADRPSGPQSAPAGAAAQDENILGG